MGVLAALEEPLAARLVAEIPDDPGRWRLTHALVREFLYEALGAARRVALHRTIGETLATTIRPPERGHANTSASNAARGR